MEAESVPFQNIMRQGVEMIRFWQVTWPEFFYVPLRVLSYVTNVQRKVENGCQ